CGSKTAPVGANIVGSSGTSTQPPGGNNASRQSPLEGASAGVGPPLGASLPTSGNPLDGPLSDDEANQLSTFIDAASHLVKVSGQTNPNVAQAALLPMRKSAKSGVVHRLSRLTCWGCGGGRSKSRQGGLAMSSTTLAPPPNIPNPLAPHSHSSDHIHRLLVDSDIPTATSQSTELSNLTGPPTTPNCTGDNKMNNVTNNTSEIRQDTTSNGTNSPGGNPSDDAIDSPPQGSCTSGRSKVKQSSPEGSKSV
ncbi:hypothetical protein BIW11_13514, partial [Tropilaelaps mercedesae]